MPRHTSTPSTTPSTTTAVPTTPPTAPDPGGHHPEQAPAPGTRDAVRRAAIGAELRRRERTRQEQLDSLPPGDPDPVARAYRDSVTRALAEVRSALARLEAGTYGQCRGCLVAIPRARLEAAPAVTLCVPCATQARAR